MKKLSLLVLSILLILMTSPVFGAGPRKQPELHPTGK